MQFLGLFKVLVSVLYAGICAWTDFKYRFIDLRYSLLAGLLGILFLVFACFGLIKDTNGEISGYLYPLLPGLLLLIAAFLSKGAIGIGDAIFILVLGFYFSTAEMLFIVIFAWMMSAFTALLIIAFSKRNRSSLRKKGLPFTTIAFPIILIILRSRYV